MKFDFNVQKIEAAQAQTELLTNLMNFQLFSLTDKEIKRIKKRKEKNRHFCKILKQKI